jgi:hypothetical protein
MSLDIPNQDFLEFRANKASKATITVSNTWLW